MDLFSYVNVLIMLIFVLIYSCKNSFLMILISMEFMILGVLTAVFCFELINLNEWVFLYYLIFSVCDGVLGMSIMINMIFHMDDQNVNMLGLLW